MLDAILIRPVHSEKAMHTHKQWSTWIEIPFGRDGSLDTKPLLNVPESSGGYAIASKKGTGLYVTHYVGRSGRSIRERLRRHLTGNGNSVIASQVALKKSIPSAPVSMASVRLVRIACGKVGARKMTPVGRLW